MNRKLFVEDTVRMLRAQGSIALSPGSGGCSYRLRGEDGCKKCAFGLHIPEHLYNPLMEMSVASRVLLEYPAVREHLESIYGKITIVKNCFNTGIIVADDAIGDAKFFDQVQWALHDIFQPDDDLSEKLTDEYVAAQMKEFL